MANPLADSGKQRTRHSVRHAHRGTVAAVNNGARPVRRPPLPIPQAVRVVTADMAVCGGAVAAVVADAVVDVLALAWGAACSFSVDLCVPAHRISWLSNFWTQLF
jgi:hypothetical protein